MLRISPLFTRADAQCGRQFAGVVCVRACSTRRCGSAPPRRRPRVLQNADLAQHGLLMCSSTKKGGHQVVPPYQQRPLSLVRRIRATLPRARPGRFAGSLAVKLGVASSILWRGRIAWDKCVHQHVSRRRLDWPIGPVSERTHLQTGSQGRAKLPAGLQLVL